MTGVDSILVYVGLDLIGDGLMKLPFLRALRANWPDARITWCAGSGKSVFASALRPVTEGLLDEVIETAGFGRRWRDLWRRPLGERRFDLVIDTQRRIATSLSVRRVRHGRFISAAAGFALSDGRPVVMAKPPSMVGQLAQLVRAAGGNPDLPVAALRLPEETRALAAELLPSGHAYVGVAPGAGNRVKSWPLEKYLELARGLAPRAPVFILGPGEQEWIARCRAVPGAILPLQAAVARGADPSPILTIALAQRLAAAVVNDSGGGHMLAAGGAPLVSLFGPTDPAKFAPAARVLRVVRAQDFGDTAMNAIPVTAVRAALEGLLTTQ